MATFAELQTRAQHIVIDLPTSVTAQVPTLVKEAVRSLQRDHNFKVMEAESSLLSTATATRVLSAVPSDFKELRGLPYEIMADGTVRELLNPANRVAIIREWGTTAGGEAETDLHNGNPQAILIGEPTSEAGAMNFEVYPLPDGQSLYANGQYRIVVPYWKYLTALSASADTNWFTTNAEQWIVWKAASEGFFLDWDEERATFWAQKAAGARKEVIDLDKKFRLAGVRELVPIFDAAGPRLRLGPASVSRYSGTR